MIKKSNIVGRISLGSGLALALAFAMWWSVAAQAAGKEHGPNHPLHMNQIKTRAEAEALKPGDSIAMVCSVCKNVVLHRVAEGDAHVEMMTIGHKHTCSDCDGRVEVVGTSNGKAENEQVKHACSKCGADAMFVCATSPGSGGDHHQPGTHHDDGDRHKKGKHAH